MQSGSDSPLVLIVDDDAALRDGLSALLTDCGYRTAVFPTGTAATEYARIHGQPPAAAAVVDIHLPDTNGLVLSRQLRGHLGPSVPIIVLSGDTSAGVLDALPGAGATYFFSKSAHIKGLLDLLAELLPRRATAANLPGTSRHRSDASPG